MLSYLELDLTFHVAAGSTDEDFEDFIDCVTDELAKIGRDKVDILATIADARVQFTDQVAERSIDAALQFLTDLRTALHAANCHTQNWPTLAEVEGMTSREAGLAFV